MAPSALQVSSILFLFSAFPSFLGIYRALAACPAFWVEVKKKKKKTEGEEEEPARAHRGIPESSCSI